MTSAIREGDAGRRQVLVQGHGTSAANTAWFVWNEAQQVLYREARDTNSVATSVLARVSAQTDNGVGRHRRTVTALRSCTRAASCVTSGARKSVDPAGGAAHWLLFTRRRCLLSRWFATHVM